MGNAGGEKGDSPDPKKNRQHGSRRFRGAAGLAAIDARVIWSCKISVPTHLPQPVRPVTARKQWPRRRATASLIKG